MRLAANVLKYASAFEPAPERTVVYAGEAAGRRHLEAAGLAAAAVASAEDDLTSLSYISYLERYATIQPASEEATIEAAIAETKSSRERERWTAILEAWTRPPADGGRDHRTKALSLTRCCAWGHPSPHRR